jgi:hypothetical protein
VEAVESERSGPDTAYDTQTRVGGKDIAQKNCQFIAVCREKEPVFSDSGRHSPTGVPNQSDVE